MPMDESIYGLLQIYSPPPGQQPEVDIIAVHGLGGHRLKTWTAKTTGVCWLNHPDYLPRHIPRARILTWGYNASFSTLKGKRPSKDRIYKHARTLVASLAADRRLSSMENTPIIFICHSLGGLIVKRALVYANAQIGDRVAHEHAIFTHAHGILFFGTPHLGSPKATWIRHASLVLSVLKPLRLPMFETNLTAALEPDSEVLQNMFDDFLPLMSGLHITLFWEEKATKFGVFRHDFVVSRDSAAPLSIRRHAKIWNRGIASTHSGMVKFDSTQSEDFVMVMSILEAYCEGAQGEVRKKVALDRSMKQLRLEHEIMSLTSAIGAEEQFEKKPNKC